MDEQKFYAEKLTKRESELVTLKARLAQLLTEDSSDVFIKIRIVEAKQRVRKCESQIASLRSRLAQSNEEREAEKKALDLAVERSEWATSRAYDEE